MGIPAFYRRRFQKLNRKYRNNKQPIVVRWAIFQTVIFYFIILIILGSFCFLGVKYEFPVINSFMESTELKYVFGFSKFEPNLDPQYVFYVNQRPNISFSIESKVSTVVDMTVYFKSINQNAFSPSINYPKTIQLNNGLDGNDFNIQLKTLTDIGIFSLCIDITDTSFFSRNAYSKCPAMVHIMNSLPNN